MKYLLVDGHSVAHWQFWRTPLRQEHDREVGMLYAVQQWINRTADELGADHVLVALDGPNNWRNKVLPSYKMHRDPVKPVLAEQLRRLPEWLDCKCVREDGKEGDDVLAEYVSSASGDHEIVIASGDKDLLQLVDDGALVSAYVPRERRVYREADVLEAFGVPPYRLAEWLALVGDASDGVPGVPGWGEKWATVGVAHSVDKEHLLELSAAGRLPVSKRLQQTLVDMREHFERSLTLTRLPPAIPTKIGEEVMHERT